MQRPRLSRLVEASVLLLVLTGCLPSEHPLSDPTKAKVDKRLIGVWRYKAPEGTTYFHVGRIEPEMAKKHKLPEGLMVAVEVSLSKDGRVSWDRHLFFSTFLCDRS